MRYLFIPSVLFVTACSQTPTASAPAAAVNQAAPAVVQINLADEAYLQQLQQVQRQPDVAGMKELRRLFVKTTGYGRAQMLDQNITPSIFQAMDQQQWADCQQKAQTLLKANAISLNGHFAAMVCAEKTSDATLAARHKQQLDLLMEAIWATGDGKSAQTAFFCTGTAELYAFIRLHGLQATGQALLQEGDKAYDKMTVLDPDSKNTLTWYFDVTSQMAAGY